MDVEIARSHDDGQDEDNLETPSRQGAEQDGDKEAGSTVLAPGQYLQETGVRLKDLKELIKRDLYISGEEEHALDDYIRTHEPPSICLTRRDVTRWKMAWRINQVYKPEITSFWWLLLVRRCTDWPDIDDIFQEPSIALGFSVAAFIYGGLHALAWFSHFDSSTEQLLWRISACVVMGGGPICFVLGRLLDNEFHGVKEMSHLLSGGVLLSYRTVLLAYVLARAYLVVESFISLSHLPAGVYDVPEWSTYFPHIS